MNVSALVRRALREAAGDGDVDPSTLMRQILADIPDGGGAPLPRLDDRRATAAAIRKRLKRR